MQNTPKGLRLQIGIFGRRNAGKSSLLNAIVRQDVAIVSETPGTTTDPVEKAMEMLPLGPVLLIDTAGLDDDQANIGGLRIQKSRKIFERCDIAILVADAANWGDFERSLVAELKKLNVPLITVINKIDMHPMTDKLRIELEKMSLEYLCVSTKTGTGMHDLRELIIQKSPEDFLSSGKMIGDLLEPNSVAVLVTPIDLEAPKGRMILPQVQAIRDTLDNDAYCIVVKENALALALDNLKTPPAIVVTDSQAFKQVSAITPQSIPLTSFSILLARLKGDLATCAAGAAAIGKLKPGSKILIAESCAHHPIGEDIGRIKIPKWISEHIGGNVSITHVQGHDFPMDPSGYELVIHCGACTFNRREMLSRILLCSEKNVPFTNYGVAIAYCMGILKRALAPFPEAYKAYEDVINSRS